MKYTGVKTDWSKTKTILDSRSLLNRNINCQNITVNNLTVYPGNTLNFTQCNIDNLNINNVQCIDSIREDLYYNDNHLKKKSSIIKCLIDAYNAMKKVDKSLTSELYDKKIQDLEKKYLQEMKNIILVMSFNNEWIKDFRLDKLLSKVKSNLKFNGTEQDHNYISNINLPYTTDYNIDNNINVQINNLDVNILSGRTV